MSRAPPVGYHVLEGISVWYVAGDDGGPLRFRDYSNRLRALPVKSLQLELLPGMRHHHFSTYGFAAAGDPEFAKKSKGGRRWGRA